MKTKITGRMFGYARVSTKGQNLDRQINLFATKYKIPSERILTEKESGKIKGTDRPTFSYLLNVVLVAGDVLVVDSISRLGRDYSDILHSWKKLSEMNVFIIIDDMPVLDTRPTDNNTLTSDIITSLIRDITTALLAYCAAKELEDKKRAQMAGIAAAREKGKPLGRPRIEIPENFAIEYAKWKQGKQTATKTMRILAMSHSSFYRYVKLYEKGKDISKL